MRIVNKETLAAMPVGTVFTLWEPYYMDGEIHIKTDDGYTDERPSWNGELYLHPDPNDISDDNLDKLIYCLICGQQTIQILIIKTINYLWYLVEQKFLIWLMLYYGH